MTYKLLVTDLDGTLLDVGGAVHARDQEAIAALLDRGVGVSICTGRMYSGTRDIARQLQLKAPVGCVDGSHIVDASSDRELLVHAIEADAAAALLRLLRRHRPATFVFADDTIYHDTHGEPYLPYVTTWSQRVQALDDLWSEPRWGTDPEGLAALISLGTEEQIRDAGGQIEREHASRLQVALFQLHRPGLEGLWGMVVRAAGVTKATAVDWLARHHGVAAGDIVAVGDWVNDIPMLQAAGRSFAMGQAPDHVKAAATDQLQADAWTGGGIAEAAERAGLL